MPIYTPWNGFTTDQAVTLNWTEVFIAQHGDNINRIILEAMDAEYPNDNSEISERKHFWNIEYKLNTARQWYNFCSCLGISGWWEGQNKEPRVYPIWATHPDCFDAPRQSWNWDIQELRGHLYRADYMGEKQIWREKIDHLLVIQRQVRFIHDKMIAWIQEKIKVLKSL